MPLHIILSVISLLAFSTCTPAQNFALNMNNFNVDIALITFKPSTTSANKYEKVSEGSPWLRKYWCEAYMTDGKGNTYKPVPIKIDLVADKLLYLDKGAEMELVTPIMYLSAIDSLTRDTLKMVRADYYQLNNDDIKGWLQVEAMGKAILLQDLNRTLFENKAYNSAVVDLQIQENNNWIILLDSTAHRIKKIKEAESLLITSNPLLKNIKYKEKGLGSQLVELVNAFNQL
jgi:hypothetical protein